MVASVLGIARSQLRYVVRAEEDRERDSYLAHRIGVNAFFCALIEAGRVNDGHGLAKWVPERTVRTADGWIRPDGYGVYLHPGGALDFYLEYDRGTETTRQLAHKLAGYVGVARDWTSRARSTFPMSLSSYSTKVEILDVIDDYSRLCVASRVFGDHELARRRRDPL